MRIVTLGCGSIGRRHLRNLQSLGYSDLLAYDPSSSARDSTKAETGVACYGRLEEIWEQRPTVALITAPSNLHTELALEAARHGCHLFIEKPLSHSFDGLDALYAEVKLRDLIAMVGCNMRFHPGPSQVKLLMDEGAIGTPISARIETGSYLPNWRPQTDYRQSYSASASQGGGAVLDCIHEIDLALWYFGAGDVIGAATLPAVHLGLEVEGLAEILLRHQNGVLSSIHLNYIQRDYHRGCEVIGTHGTLYWDFQKGQVRCFTLEGTWQITNQPDDWQLNQMYLDELFYFLACVDKRLPTFNDLRLGIETLRVALAAKACSQANQPGVVKSEN